jgi:hypothetical protein
MAARRAAIHSVPAVRRYVCTPALCTDTLRPRPHVNCFSLHLCRASTTHINMAGPQTSACPAQRCVFTPCPGAPPLMLQPPFPPFPLKLSSYIFGLLRRERSTQVREALRACPVLRCVFRTPPLPLLCSTPHPNIENTPSNIVQYAGKVQPKHGELVFHRVHVLCGGAFASLHLCPLSLAPPPVPPSL